MIFQSKTLSIGIDRRPDRVYEFICDPVNLPRWATAFCKSVDQSAGRWIVETPRGPVPIRFEERNRFGVLDHYVAPVPGVEVYIPMRVVANGSGSEVIFTLFRAPDMTDEAFAQDVMMVEQDLKTLQSVLERGGFPNA
jgi:hypothetical protein